MSNRTYCRGGFTLLEVLIAVAIMSVLALMLYSSLYIGVKARESSLEAISPYNEIYAAFEYIRKDLSCVLSPGGTLAGDFIGTDQTGTGGQAADILSMFTTSAKTADGGIGSNIIKVEYLLEAEEATDEYELINDEAAVVLKRNTTANLLAPVTAEATTQVTARNITGLNLRYYDGDEWLDAWDSSQNDNSLPRAVEVSLIMDKKRSTATAGDETVTYTKIFILDCYKPGEQQSEQSENNESQE